MGFVCTVSPGGSRIPRTGLFFPKAVPGEGRGEAQVHVPRLNPPVVYLNRVKLK